ncbi:MAG: hypothetical protein PHF56_18445 [Desulfuromonadaceae bacterium]|nr:hypothetical protein [Desulfuromonadaceae bacterium]
MDKPDITSRIQTLGRFSITIDGKPAATVWPDETLKLFFCSLLSPLDLYFTWDRICRSMWDAPLTPSIKRRLKEKILHPLGMFLSEELGCNPLIVGPESIRIDQQRVHIDAHEFYRTVLEGLQLSSLVDHSAAREKFNEANILYTGSYLPGIPGKITENARHDLETMYRTTVMDAMTLSRNSGHSPRNHLVRTFVALP